MESIERLVEAVVNGDSESAAQLASSIVENGDDLEKALAHLTDAMKVVGDKFETFELFLPEMILAADAMMGAMGILGPELEKTGSMKSSGRVIIGAPAGDMHEIGKDIVATVLKANGFEVIDLGPNVNSLTFVNKAVEAKADIIGISALMTTTMPGATEIIELLKEKGVRKDFKVMVGGAPTTKEWAEAIGTDGWAENASQAVELAKKLLG